MTTPLQLQKLYNQGQNISAFMRREMGVEYNTREIIEVSYDLQTGSYIAYMENEEMAEHMEEHSREIASTMLSLCGPTSVLYTA